MTILDKIIKNKRKELAERKRKVSRRLLEKAKIFQRKTLPLTESILDTKKTGIIAEFKRKSPSCGIINTEATIEEVTTGYFRSGASALSVLTDFNFFGGDNNDLTRARKLNPIPILRKDFIIDEYQVIESKAIGADAILLIAAVLDKKQVDMLAHLAHSLGLQSLLEIHNPEDLDLLNEHIDLVGVNNRDLKTFAVDLDRSLMLADKIPGGVVKISESGISSPLIIRRLKNVGYQGFLIGESFMRTRDPVTAFSGFVKLII